MLGVTSDIFRTVLSSTRILGSFFSVASTTPFDALMPRLVAPPFTACSAYSIWTSLPEGENVVKEKLERESERASSVRERQVRTRGSSRRVCVCVQPGNRAAGPRQSAGNARISGNS